MPIEIQIIMKCQYCNTELKQGAKFCPNCGKEVVAFDVCIGCGKQIKKGAPFCPHCGANQKEVAKPVQETEVDKSEPSTIEVSEPQKQAEIPVTESHDEMEEVFLMDEGGNSSKKWLWIIGALLIGVIGCGFYFWNTNKGGSFVSVENDSDSVTVTDTVVTDLKSVEAINTRLTDIFSKAFNMSDEDAINNFFSKEYRKLYAEVEQYDNTHIPDGDVGFWNGNIWYGGQDGNPEEAKIVSVHYSNDDAIAYAEVNFIHQEGEFHSENFMSVDLVFEDENWYIDEINGFKQRMKEYVQSANEGVDLVGKVYEGSGSLGHTGINMTISFFANNKCVCVSDWYQEYPEPKKVEGSYEIKDDKVIVRCNKNEFVFDIAKDYRVLEINNGMEMNFMTLELEGTSH